MSQSQTLLGSRGVQVNRLAPNLGCFRNKGLYQHPSNASVVIHYVRKAQGMQYLMGLLTRGEQHHPLNCTQAAGVELPGGWYKSHASLSKLLAAGQAWLSFDQERSKLQINFGKAALQGMAF